MSTTAELEARIKTLENQQAAFTSAMRALLEGKLDGPGSAAGYVVALEGGQTTLKVELPKALGAQ